MAADGILDPLDEVHLFSLHHVYIPRINKSLTECVATILFLLKETVLYYSCGIKECLRICIQDTLHLVQ